MITRWFFCCISNRAYTYDSWYNVQKERSYEGTIGTSKHSVTKDYEYNNQPVRGELRKMTTTYSRNGSVWKEKIDIPYRDYHSRFPTEVRTYTGTAGNNLASTAKYEYTNGNLTKETHQSYASANTLVTTYTYDACGRVLTEKDPLGLTTTYAWNTRGLPASVTNHKGKTTTYSYTADRLAKTTWPDNSGSESSTLSWVTSPAGALFMETITTTGKPTVQVYYDALGREVRKGSNSFDSRYLYVNYQYDSWGRLTGESLPFKTGSPAGWTTYTYDMYNRPTQATYPSGKQVKWTYNGLSVIEQANGVSTTRTRDASGTLVSVSDPAGTITYVTRPDGQLTSVTAPGGAQTTFGYDAWGRRTSMTDPSFGQTTYTYDTAGNLQKETDANNKATEYKYDRYHRMTEKKTPELTVTYTFNSDGLLQKEAGNNSTSTEYTYDALLRLSKVKEMTPGGKWLEKDITYATGNVSSVKYTSHGGLIGTVNNTYTNGTLTEQKLGTTSFFKQVTENNLGCVTEVKTGAQTRTYGYSSRGVLSSRKVAAGTATVQNVNYTIDDAKGEMSSRKDNIRNKTENFTYDNLNRLTGYAGKSATYDAKGNITKKSDAAASFQYATSGKPYAISQATTPASAIPSRAQTVAYNSFKRVKSITENGYVATFDYNGSYDRVKMHVTKNGSRELTRYYLGGCYEIDETGTSTVKEKLYLGGSYYTAPAVYVRQNNGSWALHYICRDHQGSVTHVTNSGGSTVNQELSYDAWGSLRNPATQTNYTPGQEPALFLGRGYTGHEHLPWFGLINMNARLYDPALGRFLSPDPYIQAPGFSQNYNRYSYCLNNPLMYTDEDGEIAWFVPVIIGAVIGAYTGASMKSGTANFTNWSSDAWKGAIPGAFIGAVAGGMFSAAIGASGMTATVSGGMYTTSHTVATQAWGVTSTIINSASINIGINAISGGGWDGAWKAGLTGAAAGAWGVTGGFGMVKGFGSANKIAQMGGKLGYQMVGTVGSSAGNNWAAGKAPFSRVTLGVGPVNLTLGKGQRLLQWQNNLGNIATNAVGLGNLAFGGKVNFDRENLSVNYQKQNLFPSTSGFGAHAVFIDKFSDLHTYKHELHHLWQSRAFGDRFLLNYGLQGINAHLLKNGSFLDSANYFEDQAYHGYWW